MEGKPLEGEETHIVQIGVVVKDVEFRVTVKAARLAPRRASSATGFEQDEAAAIADPHLRRLYRLSRKRAQAK